MSAQNHFLPDTAQLEELLKKHHPKMMILNFPSNPTSATIQIGKLEEIVNLACKYQCVIAYDNAYSEIYYDEAHKPVSILQIPKAKEIAIETHSFSKTFSMTGWRIGFAVGNPKLIAALLRLKTNIDSGPLISVQEVASFGLKNYSSITNEMRAVYRERKDLCIEGLKKIGIEYFDPKATFFVWCRVPNGMPSMDFCKKLIKEQGLVVTPGIGFGSEGEGFFRLSLTVAKEQLISALDKLSQCIKS